MRKNSIMKIANQRRRTILNDRRQSQMTTARSIRASVREASVGARRKERSGSFRWKKTISSHEDEPESTGRFKELLQGLGEEHDRELDIQKKVYEEMLLRNGIGMGSTIGVLGSMMGQSPQSNLGGLMRGKSENYARSATVRSSMDNEDTVRDNCSIRSSVGPYHTNVLDPGGITAALPGTMPASPCSSTQRPTTPAPPRPPMEPPPTLHTSDSVSPTLRSVHESESLLDAKISEDDRHHLPEFTSPVPSEPKSYSDGVLSEKHNSISNRTASVGNMSVGNMSIGHLSIEADDTMSTSYYKTLCPARLSSGIHLEEGETYDLTASSALDSNCPPSTPAGDHRPAIAMNVEGVIMRWANLVLCAINVASVDLYFPRQVWKDSVQTKYMSQEQLAHSAWKHLKKMTMTGSTEHIGAKRRRGGEVNLNLSDFWATLSESKFEGLDPHAGPRLTWTFVAMLFMLYDLLFVPMQSFNPPYYTLFYMIDVAAQVYWTLDIFVCFVTAVYVKSMLERRLKQIARNYARTWLPFDLLVTLPQWYSFLAGETGSQLANLENLRGIRFVRMLRFLRLARLAKFDHVLREAMEVINSPYILIVIGIAKLMLLLCLFNHIICCIWFSIGIRSGGWVEREGLHNASIWYQYLSSIHWALTQFQGTSEIVPGNTAERGYAVVFLLSALIILACFVSSLTTNMGQLREIQNERNFQQRAVRSYLSENSISTGLCVQVNRYIEWNRRQKHRKQQDAEILLVLPTKLLMNLYDEVRGPVLAVHPIFCNFRNHFSRVLRRLCYEALEQISPCPSELVYAEGDECFHMYFIISGQLRYDPQPARLGRMSSTISQSETIRWEDDVDVEDQEPSDTVLDTVFETCSLYRPVRVGENDWLSEAVLWTDWEHRGDLNGLEDCSLLLLDALLFAGIVKTFMAARSVASLYARNFVVCLNRFGCNFTDVINLDELFDNADEKPVALKRGSSTSHGTTATKSTMPTFFAVAHSRVFG